MTFVTKRLTLRPWSEDDAEQLYRYASDPRVGPAAGWPVHTSVENSREIIRTVLSAPGTYAVVLRETNEVVGSVGLMTPGSGNVEMQPGEMELGYWIGRPLWGQGLIPEACAELLRYAFTEKNCTAVWCCYFVGNEKSARVQEKLGFRYHHTECGIKVLGELKDEVGNRLTREEWELGK